MLIKHCPECGRSFDDHCNVCGECACFQPTAEETPMQVSTTRRSIATQLRDHCAARGLSIEVTQHQGALAFVIDGGEPLNPGQAADKYLPGGFTAAYGGK